MTAHRPASIGEARRRHGVAPAALTRPAADNITGVARNPSYGIFRKHGYGKNSHANLPWEKSMPFAKSLSHHRSRSQIEPARRIYQRPDVNGDRAPVIPLWRDGAPTRRPAKTMSARIAKAGATV